MEKIAYVFLLIMFLLSCDDSTTAGEYDDIPLEDEIILDSDLIVEVDPRIELLSVVQHFTSWADKRHTKYESRYKNEIEKYFQRFSEHKAIQLSQELTNNGFSYDAPPNFVLYHSNPPEFKRVIDYSDYLIGRGGSKTKLETFAEELRNFAAKTDFNTFFESQIAYFRKILWS